MGTVWSTPFFFSPIAWLMFIFMFAWWFLILLVFVVLIKWLLRQVSDKKEKNQPSLEILKERYARGEINKEEFEEKKKDLS